MNPKCPRISLVGFAFAVTILLHSQLISQTSQYDDIGSQAISPTGMLHSNRNTMIRIFYNLFIESPQDEGRVMAIIDEQFRSINPELHHLNVSINSIGHRPSSIPNGNIREHHEEGSEGVTLHSLWEYCQANDNNHAKVVYLHSKGSYHPDENNNKLRRFLTEGALSRECAYLPDTCNICSARMSTHPHPHTSGNMWLARCSYVAKLLDPYELGKGNLPSIFNVDNGCKGFGRYFFEHWVYSHPSVKPCDLYPGKEFTWAYENIPIVNFTKDLQKAPRFEFDIFVALLLRNYWFCREDKDAQTREGYLRSRLWSYKNLYNITVLDRSWFLWTFLNTTEGDMTP